MVRVMGGVESRPVDGRVSEGGLGTLGREAGSAHGRERASRELGRRRPEEEAGKGSLPPPLLSLPNSRDEETGKAVVV